MCSKTNVFRVKTNKIITSLLFLVLMFAPLVSFAQSGQSEEKGMHDVGTGIDNFELKEPGQGVAVPSVTNMQVQGDLKQLRQGSQNGEAINIDSEDGQVQKQLRDSGENKASDKATQRRSRVANAVQEMLKVAERNGGLGQQIRIIAQAQNENQEKIEAEMSQVENRGSLKKFFFGPDYKNLNSVENRLVNHTEKIAELKELVAQIIDEADVEILEGQIVVMEEVKKELENEVFAESKGFSLFGWLNKMFVK
jgi:hypothetical protein